MALGQKQMGSRFQSVMDYLERACTLPNRKWQNKTPPDWVVWLSPDLLLKPNEPYSVRLYLLMAIRPLLFTIPGYGIAISTGIIVSWRDPQVRKWMQAIFQHPHAPGNAHATALLSGLALFLVVVVPVFLALLVFITLFPRYYFWNRRARRIAHTDETYHAMAGAIAEDKTVWPPPPQEPRNIVE